METAVREDLKKKCGVYTMHVLMHGTGSGIVRQIRNGYDSDPNFKVFADGYAGIVGTRENIGVQEQFREAMRCVDAWIATLK